MNYTENLKFKKPTYDDKPNIQDINDNMDMLDIYISSLQPVISVNCDISGSTENNTVTVVGEGETYSKVITTSGIYKFVVQKYGTYTISMTDGTQSSNSYSITINSARNDYAILINYFNSTVNFSNLPASSTVTATSGDIVKEATIDSSGNGTIAFIKAGTYTLATSASGYILSSNSINVVEKSSFNITGIELVEWTNGSDSAVKTMIQSARSGYLSLSDYWTVGDKRSVTLTTSEQVELVISQFGNYESSGSLFQFDFVDCLATTYPMNSSSENTNVGGYSATTMYNTTLPTIYNLLPQYLKDLMLTFNVKASAGNKSTTIDTIPNNKLALRSEIEIFNTTTYSFAGEGTQVDYYKTSSNRIKKLGKSGSVYNFWERSPYYSDSIRFCCVLKDGTSSYGGTVNGFGVAPFGCV